MGAATSDSARLLRQALARIRRRWFVHVWARLVTTWALATAAAVLAAAGVLAIVRPTGSAQVAAAAAVPAFSAAVLVVLGWAWRRRPSDLDVARYAEERVPELEERLLSAVDVLGRGGEPASPLQSLVLAEGARAADNLDTSRVLPSGVVARRALVAALSLAVLAVALIVTRPYAERAWQTARALWFPSSITLRVEPGDTDVVENGAVPLRVSIDGVRADAWDAAVEVRSASAHLAGAPPMSRDGDAWVATIPAGAASFFYRVTSGGLVSPEYRVEVRRIPRVERIAISYEYPAFSGLAPRTEDDGGDVFAPAGTKVTLRVHTQDPVASGTLALANAPAVALAARGERVLEGQLTVTADDAYRVSLLDPHGLRGEGALEYFIRPMEDRPPEVRILRPGGDARVTRLEEVVIEARADDDFGVSRFELVYAPRGGAERVVPLGRGGATSVTGQHTVFVEDLDVRPGDFVTYYARARDVGRGKRPTETRSDIFFLEVRPFNEEFEAAQTQAGSSGGDGQFEDLARLQKDIIVATWRLDRRSGAGRSTQDIRTVATSQADVRARAERMAGQFGGGAAGRRPGAQPIFPVPNAGRGEAQQGPMGRAVQAMTRAQQALEALDTAAALPHEQEALNEILRAQAEVRRRQVARQQQSRGGRGGQSGNQDLSALFDRELQRQQGTNYEQRATAERRETRREDASLDRLKELAARQDELGRQQQELARRRAQMSAEELKRRLQRLTREQEELRQQADTLARQLQRESGQQDQQGQEQGAQAQGTQIGEQRGEPSGQQAQGLRDAAREMAGAAGDLQRESLDAASARAARATERLRAAAREMEGARPDERRRRAADVQSEARQLAEAQRRLAAAAASTTDAASLGRLAGQQARLADRAASLEEAARELARAEPGGARGEGVRRAARDLESARVGDGLRRAAEAARRGADGQREVGQAARELEQSARGAAQPLDRLADTLATASGQDADARRLSDGLARTQRLREQMDEIQRRAGAADRTGPQGQQGRTATQSADAGAARGERRGGNRRQDSSRGSGQQDGAGRGDAGGDGGGSGGRSAADLQEEMLRELREQPDLLEALRRENPGFARALTSLEGWTPSRSAPGTEAWKQDYARWEVLRQQMTVALDRHASSLGARLAARESRNRLDAGPDDRPADAWRRDIAEYFKELARTPRR